MKKLRRVRYVCAVIICANEVDGITRNAVNSCVNVVLSRALLQRKWGPFRSEYAFYSAGIRVAALRHTQLSPQRVARVELFVRSGRHFWP